MVKKRNGRRGFTLMELLIVVAIIAILTAISIPVFAGQLEKSKLATCEANRRSLKSLVTNAYITGGSEGVKQACADNPGLFVCPDGGTISYYIDESTGACTVSCTYHDTQDAALQVTGQLLSSVTFSTKFGAGKLNSYKRVDSTAASSAEMKTKLLTAMKQNGVDLEKMGVNSWALINDSSSWGVTDFIWSTYGLSGSTYAQVPVIGYNYASKSYYAGLADVGRPSGNYTYNVLEPNAESSKTGVSSMLSGGKTFSSYADALAYYNALTAVKK